MYVVEDWDKNNIYYGWNKNNKNTKPFYKLRINEALPVIQTRNVKINISIALHWYERVLIKQF